jgi:hypothetical protein
MMRRDKERGTMERNKQVAALQSRFARLAARLADPGLLLQGTINTVRPRRPDPAGGGKTKTYGPYYQWTWKQQGKTVTVNLAAGQRRAFRRAIANQRRMEETLAALRDLSRQILDLTTQGVPKRNR